MCAIFSNENHPIYSIFGHLPNTICFGMLYTCLEGMHSRIRRCFLAWSGACKWYLTPFHPSCRVKRTGHDNQFIWWVFMWEQKKNEFSPFFSFFHPNTRWWGVLHDRCRFILPLKTCELNRFYDDHVHISLDSIHLFHSRVFVRRWWHASIASTTGNYASKLHGRSHLDCIEFIALKSTEAWRQNGEEALVEHCQSKLKA